MKIPDELKKFNLQYAKREVKRRLICTSEGGPGTGKTDLFYRTAPRPALVIQGDLNDEGVREQYSDDEDIVFHDVIVPPFTVHDEAQRIKDMKIYAEQIRDLYNPAVTKGYFRSIMIDEGVWLYTLVRRSFLTDLSFGGAPQSSYAPINAAMSRFYTLAKQHRVNLYIPHRQKDSRTEDGKAPSGEKQAGGWKDAIYEAQVHLVLAKDTKFDVTKCGDCDRNRKQCRCDVFAKQNIADKFTATITKCTQRTKIEGTTLKGSDIAWPVLGQLVFPHSEESDWL